MTNANALLTAPQPQIQGSLNVSNWLVMGSEMEDEQGYGFPPHQRCVDHFYTVAPERTPGQAPGLTDNSEPWYAFGYLPKGIVNSFVWASQEPVLGVRSVGPNVYKWDDARQYEFAALTSTNQSARDTNMASLFYTLGHVLHLNQDLTSPDHVRNDNHYYKAYFENYGKASYMTNSQWFAPPTNHGWAYWQSQGFTNLLNFWDRNKYNNISGAGGLNDDSDGTSGKKLGLAEFSNGNFLGERALYTECYKKPGDIHSFPYPRKSSTDFPGTLQTNIIIPNGRNLPTTITRNVVTKKGDGVAGFRHSILSYLGTKFPNVPTSHNTTINDDGVLQDYHNILIPKAVEYSAGLLDYFFRGTMDVTVSWGGTNAPNFTNTVQNTSGQDFHGGTFFLLLETNQVRSIMWHTNLADILMDPDASLTNGTSVDIICPGSPTNKLLLVYQGTIGWSNGAALDPVDANIGIATGQPWIEQIIDYGDYQIPVPDPYYDETIVTNLESDDFGFPITSYQVIVNYAHLDDTGTIGSLACNQTNSWQSCTLPDLISNAVVPVGDITITPDGRHLSVPMTATDDPKCRGWVGWWDINITWRAWPSP